MATVAAAVGVATTDYKVVAGWGELPAGMTWGEVPGVSLDRTGTIVAFRRVEPPILEFSASGKLLKSWGQGLFVMPHGLRVDRDGFIWATDARAADGKGQQVFKFSRDGRVVLTLGTAGVSGDSPTTFNGPCDVAVAPNGDVFVADGHVNARVVKFSKDGTYLTSWGRKGSGPGEFDVPHAIAIDSRGRVLVGDRNNKRIELFDQDGRFLEQWTQFGRPSGIFIAPEAMSATRRALSWAARATAVWPVSLPARCRKALPWRQTATSMPAKPRRGTRCASWLPPPARTVCALAIPVRDPI